MNTTKIKKIAVIISLLALISGANGAVAADLGTIQVTINPANSAPIDNELNAMIIAVLDGDAYLNDPGEYIPDENFTGAQGKTFTINNAPLNGTNTYTIAVAFFKEQQKSVDYGLYTVLANGTTLASGTQSGSFVSNIAGTRSGNTVSYAISIARSNPAISLTTTPPSLTNQNSVTIAGTTRKNSVVTVTGGAAAASTVANASGSFSLNVTLNQNVTNALQVKATDSAGAQSNAITANVAQDNTPP
ncbi:MAG: Ig-like domain-containing protein, partial [Patescibacteria group bacterium]